MSDENALKHGDAGASDLQPGQVLNVTVTEIPATAETISLVVPNSGGKTRRLAERLDKGLWNIFGEDAGTVKEIWEQVQQNASALKACPGPHEFQPDPPGPPALGQKFKCSLCGGTARADMVHWYLAGLDHGARSKRASQQACHDDDDPSLIK